jgi:hypothetical protein
MASVLEVTLRPVKYQPHGRGQGLHLDSAQAASLTLSGV